MHSKGLHMIACILVVIGGLNWLLFGLFQWDIGQILGGMSGMLARIIYVLVGLATIYLTATHKHYCKICRGEMGSMDTHSGMNMNK